MHPCRNCGGWVSEETSCEFEGYCESCFNELLLDEEEYELERGLADDFDKYGCY